ncbi:MAG: metal-binding protein, partial [Firmicutes bacterium]|nr:metal-binding protein [Bacillota bacterium]
SQLDELGLYRDNAVLAQLSFTIEFDAARAEYIDTGYWVELSTGAVYKKENLRPLKAVKHIKQDDTVLECLQIPRLYLYPGELNRRVRWESFTPRPLTPSDCAAIRAAARTDLAAAVKEVKNQIKNALSEKTAVCLIAYEQIGRTQGVCALRDRTGATIELCGRGSPSATACLDYLPDANLLENQVLAGRFFYDAKRGRILLEPLSIVSGDRIVRLSF